MVDPRACFEKSVTAATFIARCKDALLALHRYGYKSTIDKSRLAKVRFAETADGKVWIDPGFAEETKEVKVLSLANHSAIESLLGRLSNREVSGPVEVDGTAEDRAWLRETAKSFDVEVFEENNVLKII